MSDWEREYKIDSLRERVRELEAENSRLREELDSAEYRVRNELEPRIAIERRAYDAWALDPERG